MGMIIEPISLGLLSGFKEIIHIPCLEQCPSHTMDYKSTSYFFKKKKTYLDPQKPLEVGRARLLFHLTDHKIEVWGKTAICLILYS